MPPCLATIINNIAPKLLKTLGRTVYYYLIEYVKIKCKGGKNMNNMNKELDKASGSPLRRA